ncbi:hypothetical protein BBJ28_00012223 [Nothophytophthora sp. Chile5]|nr:hypothetical protein BBJ28_00012223 [Nothophytophthora sp. Chile5]
MSPRVATTKPGPPPPGQLEIMYAVQRDTPAKCLAFVRENATANDPQSVLDAIDTFGYDHHWMMNVGDVKGALVDQEVAKILAELGGLFGYSAVRFAGKMRELSGPSVHVYSFEISPDFAATATKVRAFYILDNAIFFVGLVLLLRYSDCADVWLQMVEFAGLSDLVTIFVGTFEDNHVKLKELGVDHVDVRFRSA